eukprot:CAMPEP_0197540590 /NCGR_PEP_ID=MMETSP1318-20131121/66453_1 /TAXON_ID=552666 /ORGANISM="Partenskyella glossopodia, Strain RCC365" /LENGTH=368 /DNA_ID=CAMNT_0043099641 /DNA_START=94 /DNA_END=1200 /DNA_ORIENTATION=-
MTLLLAVNAQDSCSYNIEVYAAVRVVTDSLMCISVFILDMRLTSWFELNGGWEATPDTAQKMLWKETVINNFGISALSTGKATLLFYDMENESVVSFFMNNVFSPTTTIMNITAIVLSFIWYCSSCNKDLLTNYILFLSAVYMVTLAYHILNMTYRLTICMAHYNCCWCCRGCLKKSARYIDSGLPNPIFLFSVKHFLLRESLATSLTKSREARRRKRRQLNERIGHLSEKIIAKKKTLNRLNQLDRDERKAHETIQNVIGLTDKIFRNDFDSVDHEQNTQMPSAFGVPKNKDYVPVVNPTFLDENLHDHEDRGLLDDGVDDVADDKSAANSLFSSKMTSRNDSRNRSNNRPARESRSRRLARDRSAS